MAWYVVSTKSPGLKFRIVKLDKATMQATLQGDTGVQFDKALTQDVLDKFGYRIENIKEAVPA
jgi:hypothetical protein